ncbi:NUDIX hydrolase [Acidothermus cellulolyticus 11B]|uniref:NUDIX hydrolase n=1 Tax=Acidothermus cellulolyticus (strain ATCC 43068 / DSM 8971 / 11B) TaxID=351607 RepID=A0LUA4_ACIC1|nr:NUDIX hydrolase [Acidothermus cellulolyticus 11B]
MREDGPASEPVRDEPAPRPVCATHRHFTGRVVSLRTDVVDLGPAGRVDRDVVEHPGAVGVIAVDAELRVLLVRQYRHPVGCLLWEPPAGLLDIPGEDPLTAARRELAEEAGYQAAEWAVLVDAFTSPGGSTEAVRIYLARELQALPPEDRHVGVAEEYDMPTRWVPLADARRAVLSGELHNPLAVMGILAACALLLDGVAGGPRPAAAPWLRAVTQ